ncbi:serine aminopeptidase domain-containing protein [Agrobacterium tumefaciens]|uniref:alpha/beta hydrolase family protein n=1 Tax=Agrobacterium tumefaciens TaxID=358 RepID=UPI00287CDB05|nr:alpha/beta hydrolase [Agrobacterium tumefaciens]MDS7595908.1 alpha/beta hydrolase [Agrobacterium tumefaciens]
MTPNITLAALLAGSLFCNPAFAADAVGLKTTTVSSQARAKDLAVTIWYPSTGQNGTPVMSGDNRIFEGAPALEDAEVKRGRFPLVLISHGSGSRAEGMAWIATKLASEGFIVAGTNHPGTTSGDSTPADTPKIWERTDDLSTLVTALTSNKDWANAIDADKIGVLGFSLGASAAMEISGARADLDAYVQYCEDYASSMDCEWFSGGRAYMNGEAVSVPKFDLRTVDKVRFEQSNRDQRIRSAVLVDPGLEVAFTSESLRKIDIPLAFINLGSVGKIPISVLSDQLAKDVQNSTYAQVNEADHFSFLPVCKPGAAAFLKSVGERDPICEPAGTRERSDIHKELETMIVSAFNRTLKPGQ